MKPAILSATALDVKHIRAKALFIDLFGSRDGKDRSPPESLAEASL